MSWAPCQSTSSPNSASFSRPFTIVMKWPPSCWRMTSSRRRKGFRPHSSRRDRRVCLHEKGGLCGSRTPRRSSGPQEESKPPHRSNGRVSLCFGRAAAPETMRKFQVRARTQTHPQMRMGPPQYSGLSRPAHYSGEDRA